MCSKSGSPGCFEGGETITTIGLPRISNIAPLFELVDVMAGIGIRVQEKFTQRYLITEGCSAMPHESHFEPVAPAASITAMSLGIPVPRIVVPPEVPEVDAVPEVPRAGSRRRRRARRGSGSAEAAGQVSQQRKFRTRALEPGPVHDADRSAYLRLQRRRQYHPVAVSIHRHDVHHRPGGLSFPRHGGRNCRYDSLFPAHRSGICH